MARTHVMQRQPTKLLAMSASEIAGLAIRVGDCIEYRTLDMLPEEPPRVCTVREIREFGSLVLDDETWISRPRLTWLKLHKVEFAQDTADGADDRQADPSDRTDPTDRQAEARQQSKVGAPLPAVCKTPPVTLHPCIDCQQPYRRTSNVQKRCVACRRRRILQRRRATYAARGRTVSPQATAAQIAARIQTAVEWWALRASGLDATAAAARLDTPERRQACRAKSLSRDMMVWYIRQYRDRLPAPPAGLSRGGLQIPASRLAVASSQPPVAGAPSVPSVPSVPFPAPSVPFPAPGVRPPHSPRTSGLAARLVAFADRLGAAEDLVSRADRALAILEASGQPQLSETGE